MTTTQAIPEYVYIEVADIVAEHIKHKTETLIVDNNVRIGATINVGITFTLSLNVLESGAVHDRPIVEFK